MLNLSKNLFEKISNLTPWKIHLVIEIIFLFVAKTFEWKMNDRIVSSYSMILLDLPRNISMINRFLHKRNETRHFFACVVDHHIINARETNSQKNSSCSSMNEKKISIVGGIDRKSIDRLWSQLIKIRFLRNNHY